MMREIPESIGEARMSPKVTRVTDIEYHFMWLHLCGTEGCGAHGGFYRPDGKGDFIDVSRRKHHELMRLQGWTGDGHNSYCPECSARRAKSTGRTYASIRRKKQATPANLEAAGA